MKITIKNENSVVTAVVAFEKEEWIAAQDKAYTKIGKTITVNGFRKGMAPLSYVKKAVEPVKMLEEASSSLFQVGYDEVLKQNQLEVFLQPSVDVTKITMEELELTYVITVKPEIKLGAYKDIEVKKDKVSVKAEEVNAKIEELRKSLASVSVKEDGVIAEGDMVNFDFEGFVDGKAFEGGKAEKFDLEIGSHQFIPGFEEQMVGLKKGEKKDIEVTFPENYTEELKGKKATFKLVINEVSVKTLPEIDDDFALDASVEGVETLEQLKAHLKEQIKAEKEKVANDKAYNELVKVITDNATMTVPSTMVDVEVESQLANFKRDCTQRGLSFEQYLQISGTTEEECKKNMRKDCEQNLKTMLVLGEIAAKEELKVEQKDVDAELEAIAKQYNLEVEKVKEILKDRTDDMINEIFGRKVTEWIIKNNKLN